MSGLVDYCIGNVINGPNEISQMALMLAFNNPISGMGYPAWSDIEYDANYSIEQGIREKVIYKMVGSMLNVIGGTTELIDLSRAKLRFLGNGFIHCNVGDNLTGGRTILSIVNIYPGNLSTAQLYGGNGQSATCGSGAINSALNKLVNSISSDKAISGFTNTTMTGRNSFIIRTSGVTLYSLIAKVILSYDEEFSIIPNKAYPYLAELVVLGVKAYIYKNCRRGLAEAVQKYGYSLDDLTDEINEYRDAGTEFMEMYNTTIRKVLAYADQYGVNDAVKMITPRRIG